MLWPVRLHGLDLDVVAVVVGGLDKGVDTGQVVERDSRGSSDERLVLLADCLVEVQHLVADTVGVVLLDGVYLLILGILLAVTDVDSDGRSVPVVQVEVDSALRTVYLHVDRLLGGPEAGSVGVVAHGAGLHLHDGKDGVWHGVFGVHISGEGRHRLTVAQEVRQNRNLVHTAVGQGATNVLRVRSPAGGLVLAGLGVGPGEVVREPDNPADALDVLLGLRNELQLQPVLGDGDRDVRGLGDLHKLSGLGHGGRNWLLDDHGLPGSNSLLQGGHIELHWQQGVDKVDVLVAQDRIQGVVDLAVWDTGDLGKVQGLGPGSVERRSDLEVLRVLLIRGEVVVPGKDTGSNNTDV